MNEQQQDSVSVLWPSAVLTEFRQNGRLCDVVIKVDDAEFRAHKIILCSCSHYFCTLFTGAWRSSDKQIYTIPGVSSEMMQLVINYAYTHSVHVAGDNVVEVLGAADQLMIPGIIQACCVFLENNLSPMNCLRIWRLVDFYNCNELRDKVFSYILQNFEDICLVSQELPELSVQELITIIQSDHLNVKKEDTVFEAVILWIIHLPDQRQNLISMLLPKVRLGLMTPSYLQHAVFGNALVKNSIECKPILKEVIKACTLFRTSGHSKSLYRNMFTRPRLPTDILLVIGGYDFRNISTNFEAYDAQTDSWVTVNAEISRAHYGAAVLNSFVYLIGGRHNATYLNTVQRFNFITYTWDQVAPMNFCRSHVSIAVENGCIYAMGGFSGDAFLNTVEFYKPETDKWIMTAHMHQRRSGASAATLNGKVYICGGCSGSCILSSAECFNPDTGVWTFIAPMRTCRNGLGVVAFEDKIFAVGGTTDGSYHRRSVEAYNPTTNRWSPMATLNTSRSFFGIGVVNSQVFVVGGYNGSTLSTVERYSADTCLWQNATKIQLYRNGLCCCVLHGLPSVAEKLFSRGPLITPSVQEA
ncbi:hypothetical protein INR49_001840, partial [Caranx melampygus]